jgi:hypothetical protein
MDNLIYRIISTLWQTEENYQEDELTYDDSRRELKRGGGGGRGGGSKGGDGAGSGGLTSGDDDYENDRSFLL